VHHLSVGIPNYNLQAAHNGTDRLRTVPQLTLRQGLRATRLKLWDERRGRLVTFREVRGALIVRDCSEQQACTSFIELPAADRRNC
jgi:omega-6 fatty acid desaturase (delta-12 desaturase)